jgi:PPOX class probable F420-dependent enzyme
MADSTPITLSERARTFLEADRFATLATLDADGRPRQAVTWYTLDGDEIVLNSAVGRRWPTNLVRDARLSIAVSDGNDPYRWVGLTGSVTLVTDQATAQADIAAMCRRYHADDPDEAERLIRERYQAQQRISFRFHPASVHEYFE